MGYQERDRHIVDYHMYELPGIAPYPGAGRFRGPPVTGPDYIACVGAAQTFGCFCAEPYPALLRNMLGIETMNLGYGGAGPTFHNSNERLLGYINQAQLVVVQVMSARSQSNSMFRIRGHAREGIRIADGAHITAERFYRELAIRRPESLRAVVAETRANYVQDSLRLMQDIKPPKILLWFSARWPDYQESYELPIGRILGSFPQLVNRAMMDQLSAAADCYVECVTARGLPQPLFDRAGRRAQVTLQDEFGAYTITDDHNRYYPSPEMHIDAANSLAETCQQILLRRAVWPRPRAAPPRLS